MPTKLLALTNVRLGCNNTKASAVAKLLREREGEKIGDDDAHAD